MAKLASSERFGALQTKVRRAQAVFATESLRGAALAGLFARGINVVGSLLITPLAASSLPFLSFQQALVLLTLTAFAPLGDLGVGLAMLSMYPAAKTEDERKALTATAYRISALGALVVLATGLSLALTGVAPRLLFHSDDTSSRLGVAMMAAAVAISIATNARLRILAAMGRQVEQNLHYGVAYVLCYGVAISSLVFAPSLLGYLGAMTLLPQLLMLATASLRLRAIRPVAGARAQRSLLWPILKNAGAISTQTIAITIAVQSDVVLTTHILGQRSAAELALVNRVLSAFMLAASMIFNPLWPALARALSHQEYGWVHRTIRRALSLGAAGAIVFAGVLFAFGTRALDILSSGLYQASSLYWWSGTLWCLGMALHYPLAMLVNAAARKRLQIFSFLSMLVVNLPMTILLLPVLGPPAALLANAISYTVCTCLPFYAYYRVLLRRSQARHRVALPTTE